MAKVLLKAMCCTHTRLPASTSLPTLFLLMALSAEAKEAHCPKAADFPSDIASIWFDLLYDVVKTKALSPRWPPDSTALRPSPCTRRSCSAAKNIGRL